MSTAGNHESLNQEDQKLKRLVEGADTPAHLAARDGTIGVANEHMARLLGYRLDELYEVPAIELFHPQERDRIRNKIRAVARGDAPFPLFTTRLLKKKGAALPVDFIGMPVTWRERAAYLNFVRDLTVEQRLKDEIQAAQRLQSVGTLAGGVAHDFNNLLMAISGNVSLMLFDIDKTHPHYQPLMEIEEHVRSGARLANELLGYAREGKHETTLIDLRELAEQTLNTFARTCKDIVMHPAEDDGSDYTIMGDRDNMERVLLNLYINAGEAMPNGGELFLTMGHSDRPALDVDQSKQAGPFVHLAVSDTGEGMSDEELVQAFEPFYSTKQKGRGTGLGLSSAYGIVKRHGGFIKIHSPPGQGVTVDIYLPAAQKTALKAPLSPTQAGDKKTMILLVDDEDSIIKLGERMLNRLGYTVISAKGGEEAIAIYKKCADQIDLVIVDMIMPGMNGEETWHELKAINPDVTVLVASGYSESQADEILKEERNQFMQKPYDMKTLSTKLDEMLGGGAGQK